MGIKKKKIEESIAEKGESKNYVIIDVVDRNGFFSFLKQFNIEINSSTEIVIEKLWDCL